MKKLLFFICDRCRKCLSLSYPRFSGVGIPFTSKQKRTKMHFCDERCKLTFLKGRKYYARKKKLEQEAFAKLQHASGKCL